VLVVLSLLRCWNPKWWLENNFSILTVQIEYAGTMVLGFHCVYRSFFTFCGMTRLTSFLRDSMGVTFLYLV
jgi:hypothetical protein